MGLLEGNRLPALLELPRDWESQGVFPLHIELGRRGTGNQKLQALVRLVPISHQKRENPQDQGCLWGL